MKNNTSKESKVKHLYHNTRHHYIYIHTHDERKSIWIKQSLVEKKKKQQQQTICFISNNRNQSKNHKERRNSREFYISDPQRYGNFSFFFFSWYFKHNVQAITSHLTSHPTVGSLSKKVANKAKKNYFFFNKNQKEHSRTEQNITAERRTIICV